MVGGQNCGVGQSRNSIRRNATVTRLSISFHRDEVQGCLKRCRLMNRRLCAFQVRLYYMIEAVNSSINGFIQHRRTVTQEIRCRRGLSISFHLDEVQGCLKRCGLMNRRLCAFQVRLYYVKSVDKWKLYYCRHLLRSSNLSMASCSDEGKKFYASKAYQKAVTNTNIKVVQNIVTLQTTSK